MLIKYRHILLITYLYDILNSFQIDCVAENELTARINMADAKFSFQEKGKILNIYIIQEFPRIHRYHKACLYVYHQ